jgi:hypothetical protein
MRWFRRPHKRAKSVDAWMQCPVLVRLHQAPGGRQHRLSGRVGKVCDFDPRGSQAPMKEQQGRQSSDDGENAKRADHGSYRPAPFCRRPVRQRRLNRRRDWAELTDRQSGGQWPPRRRQAQAIDSLARAGSATAADVPNRPPARCELADNGVDPLSRIDKDESPQRR